MVNVEADKIYKVENGEAPDANKLITNTSYILSRLLEFALDGATVTSQTNLIDLDYTDYDDTNSDTCLSNTKIFFQDTYDNFDSSIDTTKWTATGTATETSEYIRIRNGNIYSSGSSQSLDFSTENSATKFYFRADVNNSGFNAILEITDGTNNVNIYSNGGFETDTTRVYELVFNATAQEVKVYINGTFGSTKDLSSLSNYYIKIRSTGTDADAYLWQLGKYSPSTTYTAVFDNQTVSGTTFCALISGLGTYTITHSYSIDNGSSYSNYDSRVLIDTGTFTQLKHKSVHLSPSSIDVDSENVPEIIQTVYYYG